MLSYPNADRNGYIFFVKFEFCFSIFYEDYVTTLSKHNQNKVELRRCKVSGVYLVLNIYFSDVKACINSAN